MSRAVVPTLALLLALATPAEAQDLEAELARLSAKADKARDGAKRMRKLGELEKEKLEATAARVDELTVQLQDRDGAWEVTSNIDALQGNDGPGQEVAEELYEAARQQALTTLRADMYEAAWRSQQGDIAELLITRQQLQINEREEELGLIAVIRSGGQLAFFDGGSENVASVDPSRDERVALYLRADPTEDGPTYANLVEKKEVYRMRRDESTRAREAAVSRMGASCAKYSAHITPGSDLAGICDQLAGQTYSVRVFEEGEWRTHTWTDEADRDAYIDGRLRGAGREQNN